MRIDPTTLSSFIMVGTAFAGAFVAALWLSLIFWTYRDIKIQDERSAAKDSGNPDYISLFPAGNNCLPDPSPEADN